MTNWLARDVETVPESQLQTGRGSRISTIIMLGVLLVSGICIGLKAVVTPLWYDELFTVIVSRLPSIAARRASLYQAIDANPPLFYTVEWATRRLVPSDYLGYRLPGILAFLATMYFLYLILSKRTDRISAFVGSLMILGTQLERYAYEARPYALMIACVAGAILAWQNLDKSWIYAIVLAGLLAAAESFHYYAFLVWPAFLLAEAAMIFAYRRLRFAAWVAMGVGILPLFFLMDLVEKIRQYLGTHFWAIPTFDLLLREHGWAFQIQGLFWGPALAAVAGAGLLYWSLTKRNGSFAASPGNGWAPRLEDSVLSAGLIFLPLIGVLLARITKSGIADRYMLPVVLGGALAVGYLTNAVTRKARIAVLVLISIAASLSLISGLRHFLADDSRKAQSAEAQTYNRLGNETGLPVVIAGGRDYLELAYYSSPDFRAGFCTLVDRRAAIKYRGFDTVDAGLMVFRRYAPLNIFEYDSFLAAHQEFLMVSKDTVGEWLISRLVQEGRSLRLVAMNGSARIYRVNVSRAQR